MYTITFDKSKRWISKALLEAANHADKMKEPAQVIVPADGKAFLVQMTGIPKTWYACADCGCTDVEVSAWVNVNTSIDTGDDGPTDQTYCPQCGFWGFEGIGKWRHLVEVRAECPFSQEREMPESLANFPEGATL